MKESKIKLLFCLGISLVLLGCAVLPKVYVSPDLKNRTLKRIGILGFKGPTPYSDYVTDVFTVELLKKVGREYEIVGRNVIEGALKGERIEKEDIRQLGRRLLLDTIIVGSIGEYGYLREGEDGVSLRWAWRKDVDEKGVVITERGFTELPAAALSIQMLDVESGKILFSASYARRVGRGYSVGRLAEEMAERLAASFKDALKKTK